MRSAEAGIVMGTSCANSAPAWAAPGRVGRNLAGQVCRPVGSILDVGRARLAVTVCTMAAAHAEDLGGRRCPPGALVAAYLGGVV